MCCGVPILNHIQYLLPGCWVLARAIAIMPKDSVKKRKRHIGQIIIIYPKRKHETKKKGNHKIQIEIRINIYNIKKR